MSRSKCLNVHKNTDDWRARILCPFADALFEFDNTSIRSIEGFVQALKFRPMDKRRVIALMEDAVVASKLGERKKHEKIVFWANEEIEFGSERYDLCIERMIRTRFKRDRKAQLALAATQGMDLIHRRAKPTDVISSIPAKHFCGILMSIRKELIKTGEIRTRAA